MEEMLLRLTSEYEFPILKINECGHSCPNTILSIGIMVCVDADNHEIELLEKCGHD
jgi:muramoyltetrapeptide carboxypeptidase